MVIVRSGDALDLSVVAARLMHGDYLTDENVTHRRARRVEIESDPPMPVQHRRRVGRGVAFGLHGCAGGMRVLTGPEYLSGRRPSRR